MEGWRPKAGPLLRRLLIAVRVFHLEKTKKGIRSDRASVSENLNSKLTEGRARKKVNPTK